MSTGRTCVLVMGPAGAGKSTLCASLMAHLEDESSGGQRRGGPRRRTRLLNLDPAAEHFARTPDADVRALVHVDDVMGTLGLGPNGGLIECFEHLLKNLDWLEDEMGAGMAVDEDYWFVDCPGQIELYTHFPAMRVITEYLRTRLCFSLCAVYCVDATFVTDPPKYMSACLTAMSAMFQLEVPHLNVLTKTDLIKPFSSSSSTTSFKKEEEEEQEEKDEDEDEEDEFCWSVEDERDPKRWWRKFLYPDTSVLLHHSHQPPMQSKYDRLAAAVAQLIESHDMLAFVPLDITRPSSVSRLVALLDHTTNYGENIEPRDPGDNDNNLTSETD